MCSVGIVGKISGHICIAGFGFLFGERNLRVDMEKQEEIRVVETELWDHFLRYTYVSTSVADIDDFRFDSEI